MIVEPSTQFVNQIHPLTGKHQSNWFSESLNSDGICQKKILDVLREHGDTPKSRIALLVRSTPAKVLRNLNVLIKQDIVYETKGVGTDGRPNVKVYSLRVKK